MKAIVILTDIRPVNKQSVSLSFSWACDTLMAGRSQVVIDLNDITSKVVDGGDFKSRVKAAVQSNIEDNTKEKFEDIVIL